MPVPLVVSGTIVAYSAFSGYRQAQIGNAQKRAQAKIAEINAETAELEGDLALKAAFGIEHESRQQTKQLIGTQRAAMSGTGFAVGEGSFGDILETSAVLGEMDAMVIRFEGDITKFRKQKEARTLRSQARALKASQQDPILAGLGSALGSAASFF